MKLKWSEFKSHEQNALVAEKVFGRTIYRHNTWGRWLFYHETKPGLTEAIPDYVRNLNDARLVVERITMPPTTSEEAERAANTRFGFWFDKACLWALTSREAAEAVCLHALKAKGVDIE